MFDLGWMELLIIGVVALIVVGPKDLPIMFKKVGIFVGKAKKIAREFQYTMNAAASESGLKETADVLKTLDSSRNPEAFFEKAKESFQNNEPDQNEKAKNAKTDNLKKSENSSHK